MTRLRDFVVPSQPRLPWKRLLLATLGISLSLGVLALLGESVDLLLLFAGFAPTCLLVFGLPEAPVSQPPSVVAGQVIAAFIGVLTALVFPVAWWSVALAVGVAFAAMAVLRVVHPPAVANTVLAFTAGLGWSYVFVTVLIGSIAIVIVGSVWHRFTGSQYPAPGLLGGRMQKRRG